MSIQGMLVKEEVKVKCTECNEVFFAASEYTDCECGGLAVNIKPFEAIYEQPYELGLT